MVSLNATPQPQPEVRQTVAAVVLKCPTARMFALTRLIAVLEEFDQEQIHELRNAGFTPDLVDRMRKLSLSDAWHVTRRNCGLSVSLDTGRFEGELNRLHMVKQEQTLLELFVRNGATAAMLSRLFNETPTRVRQLRALLGPPRNDGRPKIPEEGVRELITADWRVICAAIPSSQPGHERHRFKALLDRWPTHMLCALDAVVNSREMEPYVSPLQRVPAPAINLSSLPSTVPSPMPATGQEGNAS